MYWYLEVLRKYAEFDGRAGRSEYWWFFLFNMIVSLILAFADRVVDSYTLLPRLGPLGAIYGLAVLIPSLAVTIRRLHDTGRSGFWILICFVPIIGGIVLLVFMILEGDLTDNEYGPTPRER